MLGTLGRLRLMDFGVAIGYGTENPDFWLSTFDGIGPNREVHVAFSAAALDLGAECLHEPRRWPEYHDRYYAGFVRDLAGNNMEAVRHHAENGD